MASSNAAAESHPEHRRLIATRNPIKLAAKLADAASDGQDALILNISATGVLLQTTLHLAVDEVVRIDLAAAGHHAAKVVWTIDRMVGCQFLDPLPKASLSAALLQGEALSTHFRDPPVTQPRMGPSAGNKKPLGQSIALARKATGMTQGDLGQIIGVSTTTVCKWEQGHVSPRAKALARLESCLGDLNHTRHSIGNAGPQGNGDQNAGIGSVLNECKVTIATALGLRPETIRLKLELDLTI